MSLSLNDNSNDILKGFVTLSSSFIVKGVCLQLCSSTAFDWNS